MAFQKIMAGLVAGAAVGAMAVAVTPGVASAATACRGTARSDFNGDGISDVAIGGLGIGPVRTEAVHILYGTRSGLHADPSGSAPDDQLIQSPSPGRGHFGSVLVPLDFNGDGCSDLAVATPGGARPGGGTVPSGFVAIYSGSRTGLVTTGPLLLDSTNDANARHVLNPNDGFGGALAAGDFNGDRKQDLVIGAAGEDDSHGAVYIVPGGTSSATRFTQGAGGVPAGDGDGDGFGASVAAGDFDHDRIDDLAAGIPSYHQRAGGVVVVNGSGRSSLLSTTGGKIWTQDTTDRAGHGISGNSEPDDLFGASLAVGSFKGNGRTDLAIGVPGEAIGTATRAGMVNVIYSAGSSGLSVTGNQGWSQNTRGVSDTAETDDRFGFAIAAGDFNGNGRTDLAIGVLGEGIGTVNKAGLVNVLMGSSAGLTTSGQRAWSQDSTGIADTAETNDAFGTALAVGRTHSSARDDLVVGAPGETVGTVTGAGQIHMIPGSSKGLTATGNQAFNADTDGVQGTATSGELLGWAIS